jgi:hypothetical protein
MEPFVYEALPVRVIFGSGTLAQLAAEAERLGLMVWTPLAALVCQSGGVANHARRHP